MNKLCFPPASFELVDARKEEVLAVVLARQLEIRLSNLKISLSSVRLLARLGHQASVVVGFTFVFLPLLRRYDG